MKSINIYLKYGFLVAVIFAFVSCESDEQTPEDYYDNDGFTIELSASKVIGTNQYQQRVEMYRDTLNIDINVESPSELKELRITKTNNLEVDPTFGSNGTQIVDASGTDFSYNFIYPPDLADVDRLVGFTFEAITENGVSEVSDLAALVTLKPRDNMTRVRWNLTSILHVNEGNAEVIKECEKDNSLLLNADSTMVLDYGADTGSPGCDFDGFNVYTKWYLSEDEKTFTWEYYGIFSPATTVVESFEVKTFTTEVFAYEQTVDLTDLGLGIETFLYTYEATPR